MMMMNYFCGMVDRRKEFSLISSRDHCQRSSPSRNSETPQAGSEPAQSLSSGLVEWSYAVVITTTPHHFYALIGNARHLPSVLFKLFTHFSYFTYLFHVSKLSTTILPRRLKETSNSIWRARNKSRCDRHTKGPLNCVAYGITAKSEIEKKYETG